MRRCLAPTAAGMRRWSATASRVQSPRCCRLFMEVRRTIDHVSKSYGAAVGGTSPCKPLLANCLMQLFDGGIVVSAPLWCAFDDHLCCRRCRVDRPARPVARPRRHGCHDGARDVSFATACRPHAPRHAVCTQHEATRVKCPGVPRASSGQRAAGHASPSRRRSRAMRRLAHSLTRFAAALASTPRRCSDCCVRCAPGAGTRTRTRMASVRARSSRRAGCGRRGACAACASRPRLVRDRASARAPRADTTGATGCTAGSGSRRAVYSTTRRSRCSRRGRAAARALARSPSLTVPGRCRTTARLAMCTCPVLVSRTVRTCAQRAWPGRGHGPCRRRPPAMQIFSSAMTLSFACGQRKTPST